MSVCVIGAGISGYMSAIKIKLSLPEEDVMIVYQSHPSNTAICGRRFVTRRVGGKKNIDTQGILNVLREKNGFQETRSMRDFVKILEKEMKFWMNLEFPGINKIHYDEDKKWFGPRFGEITPPHCTRGSYFLSWLREITQFLGIKEYSGEVLEIVKHHDNKGDISFVKKILVKTNTGGVGIKADKYILAAGGSVGSIFDSTNVPMRYSSHHLGYHLGCTFVNGDKTMFHPFSRITLQGRSIRGCFETDNLTDATLYFSDGTIDYETMSLLKDHVAHYQFPEICKRFLEHGGIIFFQDNNVKMSAHVAVHSSSLGLKTYDGVGLVGFSNLQAVGDASSIGYWNGNQIRIPGMALSKCMVDSYLVTKNLSSHGNSLQIFPYLGKLNIKIHRKESIIQKINTRFLLKFTFTNIDFTMRDIVNWTEEPLLLPESLDREISIGIVYPHWQRLTYKTMDHTFFPQEMVEDFKKNYRSYCLF